MLFQLSRKVEKKIKQLLVDLIAIVSAYPSAVQHQNLVTRNKGQNALLFLVLLSFVFTSAFLGHTGSWPAATPSKSAPIHMEFLSGL